MQLSDSKSGRYLLEAVVFSSTGKFGYTSRTVEVTQPMKLEVIGPKLIVKGDLFNITLNLTNSLADDATGKIKVQMKNHKTKEVKELQSLSFEIE